MKFELRKKSRYEVNIVPLVDVLTVLIFFFMLTMHFRNEKTMNIVPPSMETAGKNMITHQLIIAINKTGDFFLGDIGVGKEDLNVLVAGEAEKGQLSTVLIVSDEDSALKNTTYAMDICRKHGFNSIKLQTK